VFDGQSNLFLPGIVSSEYSEVRAAVSPDGATVLWGSTNRPGGPGGWDIWISRRDHGQWSAPAAVPFDTPHKEFDPAFSADGMQVYFFSDRPGGLGGDDIWQAVFDARTGRFGEPVNPGAAVNSAGDEWAPTPAPDGRSLLFATNGRGGKGRHDLFLSQWSKDAWQPAQPLLGEVNTAADDFDATFIADGRALVFARSADVDNAPIELWSAIRDGDRYVHARKLDARINVDGGWVLGPSTIPAQPDILLFSALRTDSALGRNDIHAIRYHLH
jgi:Tol biopolymer transport system component